MNVKDFCHSMLLGCATVGGLSALSLPVPLYAQEPTLDFDIPAQGLDSALRAFAQAARQQIVFEDKVVEGKRSAPLKGHYTIFSALDTMLMGSGLSVRTGQSGLIIVDDPRAVGNPRATAVNPRNGGIVRIAAGSTAGRPVAEGPVSSVAAEVEEVNTVTVFGRGSRAETIREVPQSVLSFNRDLINAVPTATAGDIIRFIPSASSFISDYSYGWNYVVRGASDVTPTWNGMSLAVQPGKIDLGNVERMEVLMGPNSVLYGSMSPGALINFETKKPQRLFHSEVNLEAGSYDSYGASVDIGGPVSERVRVRLNASYHDSGAPMDHWDLRRSFVAPALAFDLTDQTELTLEGVYQRSFYPNGPADASVPFEGTLLPNPNGEVPRSSNLGYIEGVTHFSDEFHHVNFRVRHQLSDAISINAQVSRSERENGGVVADLRGALNADHRTWNRLLAPLGFNERGTSAMLNISADFDIGRVSNAATLGVDYIDSGSEGYVGHYSLDGGELPPIDIYSPNYSINGVLAKAIDFSYEGSRRAAAVVLQERARIGKLALVAAARYTDSKSTYSYSVGGAPMQALPDAVAKKWSTQLGVLYQFSSSWEVFANRSNSFLPRTPITLRDGSVLNAPEISIQHEVGLRFTPSGPNFTASLALFRIETPDMLTPDPVDQRFVVNSGEVVSKGVEFSVLGKVLPGWDVYLGYSYNPTEITKTNDPEELGLSLINSPKSSISAISNYRIRDGYLQGLGFSATVNHLGRKYADSANSFSLPSTTRVDLGVTYLLNDGVELGIMASNITDEDVYGSYSTIRATRGVARSYMFNVRMSPEKFWSR